MRTLHSNARTCPRSRRLLADRVLEQGWSLPAAAEAAGVSERRRRRYPQWRVRNENRVSWLLHDAIRCHLRTHDTILAGAEDDAASVVGTARERTTCTRRRLRFAFVEP